MGKGKAGDLGGGGGGEQGQEVEFQHGKNIETYM